MPPIRWIGAIAGLSLGLADYLLVLAMGLQMQLGEQDLRLPAMATIALTYGGLGWVIGRLIEERARARRDAATIERQMSELRSSEARAAQNEKLASIGRLAAGVAHEVRNPLGVIRSSAGLLFESIPEPDDVSIRSARFVREEIDRLDAYIASLLQFSRPIQVAPRAVEARFLAERVQELAGPELAARSVDFSMQVDDARGAGDPDLLAQVLFSLVNNAGQAVEDGGRVELRARLVEGELVFEVADDGPGVDPDAAERIFEPFFTTRAQGTGLGLSMAERVALAHGGRLELVAGGLGSGGRGACFRLSLPA